MGWIWILSPSSSVLVSADLILAKDIKRAILIHFKSIFHSSIRFQDVCYEPINPSAKTVET